MSGPAPKAPRAEIDAAKRALCEIGILGKMYAEFGKRLRRTRGALRFFFTLIILLWPRPSVWAADPAPAELPIPPASAGASTTTLPSPRPPAAPSRDFLRLLRQGHDAYARGDYARAIARYEAASRVNAASVLPWLNGGAVWDEAGQPRQAALWYDRAVRIDALAAMPTDCADSSLRCAVTTTGSRPSSAAKLPEMPNIVAAPRACAKTLADIEYSRLHKTHISKERMIRSAGSTVKYCLLSTLRH